MVMVQRGGYEYYVDDWLKNRVETRVVPLLQKKDQDYIIIVDGPERSGKSTFTAQTAKLIDPTFDVSRMCFSPDEFRNAILNASKGQVVVFDEAWRGFSNKSTLSEVNRILVSMMMEMGQKNLCVFIVLPSFFGLEKYVALWRSRCLFHIFKKKKNELRFWRYYNVKKKNYLYQKGRDMFNYNCVRSKFKGKFFSTMPLDDEAYRAKKKKSLESAFESKPEKINKYIYQRNVCIKLLSQNGMAQNKIAEELGKLGFKVDKSEINKILSKFKKPLEY